MASVPPMPNGVRNSLGRYAQDIENFVFRGEDPQPQSSGLWVPRNLATETPTNFRETTFRGPNYQMPIPNIGAEWKPGDWLAPEIVDQMKKNGVVKTGLFLKKAPILAVIQKSSIRHEVPRIQAYLNYVMQPILFDLCTSALFALDYGVALHEKVWKAENITFKFDQNQTSRTFRGPSIHYKKIKWNNPRTIKEIKIQDRTQDYDGYVQQAGITPIDVPVEKSFMWGKNQENSLWGNSELDAVYEYWYWLELLSGYYMRYMEKTATPPMKGYAPAGTTYSRDEDKAVENMSWLAEVAGRLQDGMAIVMPSVFDPNARHRLWDLQEIAMSTRGDLYQTAVAWLENAIFKGLFVPDKPVSQGTQSFGSYALADIQFEAFLVGEEWDLFSLVKHIQKYIIRPLIDINFGPNVADAELFHPPMSRELKQRVYEIFKDLVQGHPDFSSVNFTEIAEELGIPLYSADELKQKKAEALADAQAMMIATTPEEPATEETPTKETPKDQSIVFSPTINPIVDLSTLEQAIREEVRNSVPTPLEQKLIGERLLRDEKGRPSGKEQYFLEDEE